jgi:hypothetical protein
MRPLLVDSDVFCKLGIAGLLQAALAIFGRGVSDCGCLPALPHMLRRGRLRKTFGEAECDGLVSTAESMVVELRPSETWLDKLTGVDQIDVGEAQLFATVAEEGIIVWSGDKRALVAVARVPGYPPALAGRIVTLDAILLALCMRLGDDAVRAAMQPLMAKDRMVQMCFSSGNSDPRGALQSYLNATKRDVAPLQLWEPAPENS